MLLMEMLEQDCQDCGTYFNAGNVGIGTTDPAAKLDVNGLIQAQLELMACINLVKLH